MIKKTHVINVISIKINAPVNGIKGLSAINAINTNVSATGNLVLISLDIIRRKYMMTVMIVAALKRNPMLIAAIDAKRSVKLAT
jgi:hypothetical protein